jgi:hypothetical protein
MRPLILQAISVRESSLCKFDQERQKQKDAGDVFIGRPQLIEAAAVSR